MVGEKTLQEVIEEPQEKPRIVSCPKCFAPAIVTDDGTILNGVGYCGHNYFFKMVKVVCARNHQFDALDEEGSVHDPTVECKEIEA